MTEIEALREEIKLRDEIIAGQEAEVEDLTVKLGKAIEARDTFVRSRQRLLIGGSAYIVHVGKFAEAVSKALGELSKDTGNFNARLGEESPA